MVNKIQQEDIEEVDTDDIINHAVTNTKLAQMNSNTVKGRLSGNGTPQDIAMSDLPISTATQTAIDGKFTLPPLTSGSVLFSNGTTITQDNNNLFWNDTNNRLGIGTKTPATPLHTKGGVGINLITKTESQTANNWNQFASTAGIGEYGIWNNRFYFQNVSTTGGIGFFGSNTNRIDLSIATTGFVGVGIANLLAKLHVNDASTFTANTDAFLVTLPNTPSAQNDFKAFKVRSDGSVKLSDRYGDTTNTGLHVNYFNKTLNAFFGRNFSNLASTGLGVSNNNTGTHDFTGSIPSGITGGNINQNQNVASGVVSITSYETNNYTATTTAITYGVYAISNNTSAVTTNGGTKSYIGGHFSAQPSFSVSNTNAISIGLQARATGGQYNYAALFTAGNVGIGTSTPESLLTVNGDVEVTDTTKGVILKSPDGTRWRVTIDNTGALTTTAL